MYAHVHTLHIYTHAYAQHTHIHTHTHTYSSPIQRPCCVKVGVLPYIHTHTYTHIFRYTHIHTHINTHTHMHTHIYAHIHTHIPALTRHPFSAHVVWKLVCWRRRALGYQVPDDSVQPVSPMPRWLSMLFVRNTLPYCAGAIIGLTQSCGVAFYINVLCIWQKCTLFVWCNISSTALFPCLSPSLPASLPHSLPHSLPLHVCS